MIYDVIVVGGGIVGLSTAFNLQKQNPRYKILLLEKEPKVAQHQTGHNSGVIHSGIYYKPGSYKARLCREGYQKMVNFCETQGIAYDLCGKIIVATNEAEIPHLKTLQDRAEKNGLENVKWIGKEITEYEPNCCGIAGLHVPQTGIVDYKAVCVKLKELLRGMGVDIHLCTKVLAISTFKGNKYIATHSASYQSKNLINCGGLYSDKIAEMDGFTPPVKIVPFRGEYYKLNDQAKNLVNNLIYPVPDPAFPFLGVHFTRMIDGKVECGPNAVFAFRREGYGKFSLDPRELIESLCYPGVLRLFQKHWRMGLGEYKRSFLKKAFVQGLQKLVPSIREEHITPVTPGVRAQAVTRDGKTADDFIFEEGNRSLHVLNAPSPAATASLAIGQEICNRFKKAFS
ncbi:MAG: L-2-hydroxyglutarate oxidase [Fibrobacteria bacterium]|nr:L-2-hydroxyglutarate oxidase [Fibrobacteria bacterium]